MSQPIPRFTDYVLTIDRQYSEAVWDYLENEALPIVQQLGQAETGLSSHECNDDGDTFHSLLTRNDILAERLNTVLGPRNVLLADLQGLVEEIIRGGLERDP